MIRFAAISFLLAVLTLRASACELCAVYSADSARENIGAGFLFTVAEQYVSSGNLQVEGEEFTAIPFLSKAYVKSAYTHLVPGYNFSSRFGLSLNAPIIHRKFRRTQFFSTGGSVDEKGTVTGLGDVALIARASLVQKIEMDYSIGINLLAGIKFPTGDTERLDNEVDLAKVDLANYGPSHSHSAIGGVHQHDLSLGSGSFDGVFGLASNFRWKRWFFNNQLQYYLRSEGRGYEFGDLIIVSGGPGAYILLGKDHTLSIQANVFYEKTARDKIIGQRSDQTGTTAWYMGPLISFTLGKHLSATAGADIPLDIYNNGLQTVPDYRIRGGITWRF